MLTLFDWIANINIWLIVKILLVIGLSIYLVFAFIVVRQVKLMTEVVSGILTSPLRVISWVFFLFSLGVFAFVLVFL